MSRFPMNRYDEQRLIQEVHYLHSLWHQGPPRPHPHPPIPTHPTPIPLQPSSSTKFKKRKIKNPKKLNKEAIIDSGIEWPCPKPVESSPVTESGWGSFKPQPILQPHLPTDQELANFASNRAHQGALKAVSDYFEYSIGAEEDDEEDDDDDEEKGEKSYGFFAKLFEEDGVLREYYEKNGESGGEFNCLVCCGAGKKGWKKRFKDCVALVQHSITIANMRQTHRAYGQVICKILGWDFSRLPSIVLIAGYKASESSDKPVEGQVLGSELQTSSLANLNEGSNKTLQGNEDDGGKDGLSNTTDTVNIGSVELSQQEQSFSNENQQENGGGSTALEHNSTIEASVSNAIPETAKENTKNASNCPGRSRCARRKTYKRRWLKEMAKLKEKNTVAESEGLGNEEDGDKDGLSGLSNTTDTVNIGSDELSQQKQSLSNENQQEDGGSSTALEHKSPLEATVSTSIPEIAKENTQGASNGPGRSKAARRRAAKRQCLRETAKIKEEDTVAGSEGLGNEDGGRDGLSGLSNTTDTVNIGNDELSQQKQSLSNENQQEDGGGSTALEHNCPIEASINTDISETAKENTEGASNCPGNEGDGGKNSLSGQSHTTDNVNIGSNEVSQQKEPSSNENQQDNGGGSTVLEHNSTSEVNANRSWEDVSNDMPETAKENAEGASNCPELSPDMIVANEENDRQKHEVLTETTIVSDKVER